MSNTLILGKKAFTWTVVVATIAWAMSAAFIAIPLTAKAATLTAGDLIVGTAQSTSGPGRPVYYYGSDAKKYLFPSSNTYKTWYGTSFAAVKNLTQAEVDAIPSGDKNTTAKPGSCVQFVNDSAVYVVDGATRRTADATVCPSADVYSVPEGFRANYASGTAWSGDKAALATAANLGTVLGTAATVTTPAATGALTVALASDSPSGAVVPGGASSVVLAKYNVTAGAAAQTITGVTVKSAGVGSANDFSAIYLYDGATRLTSGRTLTSQTKQTEFAALSIAVAASTTKALSVVADINSLTAGTTATAGDTHAFQLTALVTTATVSGLPVTGATHSIGSQGVSTVTLTRGSDPANPTIGQTGVAIGEFRLTAGVNDTEVRRVIVTVGGTVTVSDLSAFTLYQGSTKLADGAAVSDRVTFDLSSAPFALGQGTNRLFTIKANVAGRGSRTITTYIDSTYPADLLVVDKLYGYGATGTLTSFSAAATAAATPAAGGSFVTTQGGRVTVAFNGPSASDVSLGSQDVPFYKFSLTAGDQALDVREVELVLTEAPAATAVAGKLTNTAGTTNYFTDVKIKDADTGAVLMGPVELSGATLASATSTTVLSTATWDNDFTQSWTLDAGKTRNLVVTADIASSETTVTDITTRGYAVTLSAFPSGSIREISTNQNIATTDIVGGQSAVTGNTMTVRSSSLTVQLASTPVSGTTVKGTSNVQMAGMSFAAGTQSDVKVTQIVMTGMGDDTGASYTAAELDDVVITAQLYDGDTAVSTAKSPTTAGVLTFDNLNWTIPAGSTKKLVAKVNTATTLMSSATDTAWLGINAAADITAQDKDGNSVTATDGDATWSSPINGSATTATVLLTVNAAGTLTVARDGDTPLANLVVGGTNDVSLLKVKFTAANEAFNLKKLRIANEGTESAADGGLACVPTEGTPFNASDCDTGITQLKIKYPKQDGTTGTKTGVLSSGLADFSDLDAYLALDKNSVIEVLADLSTVTTTGISGDMIRMALELDSNFEAVGVGSGSTLDACSEITAGSNVTCDIIDTGSTTDSKADLFGNYMTVRKSKPTVTLHAASPSGASVPGLNEVLRFTVAADAAGDTVLERITFRVNTTANATSSVWDNAGISATGAAGVEDGNLTRSDFSIYESGDTTTALEAGDADWEFYGLTGTALVSGTAGDAGFTGATTNEDIGYARVTFTSSRTIAAGTSKTYVLKVDTTNASSASDDTFRVDVVDETATVTGTEFRWEEVGTGATTDIAGTSVKNLPVNGGTIIY